MHFAYREMDDYFEDVADAYFIDMSDIYDLRPDIKGIRYGIGLWYREARDYARREVRRVSNKINEYTRYTLKTWRWFFTERDYVGGFLEVLRFFNHMLTMFRFWYPYVLENLFVLWPVFLYRLFCYRYVWMTGERREQEMLLLQEKYFSTAGVKISEFKRYYLYWTLFMRLRIIAAYGDGGVYVNYLWQHYLPAYDLMSLHPEDIWRMAFPYAFWTEVKGPDNELYPKASFLKIEYTKEERIKLKDTRYNEGVDGTNFWWLFI
jgi:hypothetical protein